jgi:hypothetical protein
MVPHEIGATVKGVYQRRIESIDVGEHDLRALGREQLRCRCALPAAPSGDDCDLACETRSLDASLPSVAERSRSVLCDRLCGADDETCEPLIVRSSRSTGPAAEFQACSPFGILRRLCVVAVKLVHGLAIAAQTHRGVRVIPRLLLRSIMQMEAPRKSLGSLLQSGCSGFSR